MRNLKKLLSLVMALAMVASFMVAGASAAKFTDSDKIENADAVNTLVELGVINGRDTGAFDPTGTVTRAEMAKMLCIVMNGGKDPNLTGNVGSFPDTKTHWAAGYIDFCKNLRIVVGSPDGNFYPDKTVTGTEAAKMILMALGYDAVNEKFSNDPNWETNINVAASTKGLFDGVPGLTSTGLSRDNAAQMIYNGLNAKMIEYKMVGIINGNGVSQASDLNKTLLEEKFKAVKVEGIVVANEWANLDSTSNKGAALDTGKTKIAITNSEDQTAYSGTQTFSTTTGLDMLGRSVVVYVRTDSNASKAKVFGSVSLSGDNVEYKDASSDSIATVADDKNVNITSSTMVATNYGNMVNYKNYTDAKSAGVEKVLIDNDNDGDAEYVLMNTYTFGKVTNYTSTGDGSITIGAGAASFTGKKSDTQGFEDVAKNDYVMAAYIGGKLVVEKAESVSGNLEAYKGSNPVTKLTVDGTDYKVSVVPGYVGGTENIQVAKDYGSTNLGNEATFFLDKNGYIVAVGDVAESAYNYALVLATGSSIDDRVKVALPDGTTGTYNLSSGGKTLSEIRVGQVYAYTINSSKAIKLTQPTTLAMNGTTQDAKFTKGKTTITGTDGTAYANQNTVFYYTAAATGNPLVIDTTVNTYIGYSKAPSLDANKAKATVYQNGSRVVAVVFTGANLTTTNVSDNLYISSLGNTTSDYTYATAFVNGKAEAQTIKIDNGSSADAKAKEIYTYSVNSDGYYELKKVGDDNRLDNVTVDIAGNKTTVFAKGSTKTELGITADTLLVDHSEYLDDPIAQLGVGPDVDATVSYVVYDKDGTKANNALLVVVRNPKTNQTPEVNTDVEVINSDKGNFYANPTFYRADGSTISAADKQTALAQVMKADGCTNISFTGMTSVTYTPAGGTSPTTNPIASANQVYKVAAPTVTGTVTGYAGTVTATADVTYAAAGATVTVTLKATQDGTATANSVTATATVTPSTATTAASGTASFSDTELKSATDTDRTKTITFTMAATGTVKDITGIAIALS